jgi:hypothetical protein
MVEDHAELGTRSIGGSPFKGPSRPSRTFASGRVCGEDECNTKLSIYNDSDFCFLHEPQVTPRMRGRKIA